MIKSLRLINWKSFDDATLYIDPLTILIGSNASGKSNCLDALTFLSRISQGIDLTTAIAGNANILPLRGGLEWVCRKPSDKFRLEVTVTGDKDNVDYRYIIEVKVSESKALILLEQLIKITARKHSAPKEYVLYETDPPQAESAMIQVKHKTGKRGGKKTELFRDVALIYQINNKEIKQKEINVIGKICDVLQNIDHFDPIPSHMRDYSALAETLRSDAGNIAGVLAGLEEQRQQEIEQKLTAYLKKLPEGDIQAIKAEKVGKFGNDAMLYCTERWREGKEHWHEQEVDARGMSDGTLRYLAIVAALMLSKKGSLLVIEEVDNGLHPSRAHQLIAMLQELGKERQIDILITTHNPALLDAAGMDMLPFITVAHRDDHSGSSTLTLLEDLTALPKLIASGSLGTLSSRGQIEQALHSS